VIRLDESSTFGPEGRESEAGPSDGPDR
jgi:hypothetical protein